MFTNQATHFIIIFQQFLFTEHTDSVRINIPQNRILVFLQTTLLHLTYRSFRLLNDTNISNNCLSQTSDFSQDKLTENQ